MSFEVLPSHEVERLAVESSSDINQVERDWVEVMKRMELSATLNSFLEGCGQDLLRVLGKENLTRQLIRCQQDAPQVSSIAQFIDFIAPKKQDRKELLGGMIDQFHVAQHEYLSVVDTEESADNNLKRREIQLEYLVRRESMLGKLASGKHDFTTIDNFQTLCKLAQTEELDEFSKLLNESEKERISKRDEFQMESRELEQLFLGKVSVVVDILQEKSKKIASQLELQCAQKVFAILEEVEKIHTISEGMSEQTRAALDATAVIFERRMDSIFAELENEKVRLVGPLEESVARLEYMVRLFLRGDSKSYHGMVYES